MNRSLIFDQFVFGFGTLTCFFTDCCTTALVVVLSVAPEDTSCDAAMAKLATSTTAIRHRSFFMAPHLSTMHSYTVLI